MVKQYENFPFHWEFGHFMNIQKLYIYKSTIVFKLPIYTVVLRALLCAPIIWQNLFQNIKHIISPIVFSHQKSDDVRVYGL